MDPKLPFPAPGNLLVRPEKLEPMTTPGGIVLSDQREQKQWARRGVVVRSASSLFPEGEIVFYGEYNASQVDADHWFVNEREIQGAAAVQPTP